MNNSQKFSRTQTYGAYNSYFSADEEEYEYSPQQAGVDDVRAALAEWELEGVL